MGRTRENEPMDKDGSPADGTTGAFPSLGASPFGTPPADDPASWRYGVLIPTYAKKRHVGFFIDHEAICHWIGKLRVACPAMNLADSFLNVATSPPILSLAEEWRDDLASRGHDRWPGGARPENLPTVYPYGAQRPSAAPESEDERFAWITVRFNNKDSHDDESSHEACLRFAKVWRQDLESRGMATADWIGESLLMGNGYQSEEIQSQARAEAEEALLAAKLRREVRQCRRCHRRKSAWLRLSRRTRR